MKKLKVKEVSEPVLLTDIFPHETPESLCGGGHNRQIRNGGSLSVGEQFPEPPRGKHGEENKNGEDCQGGSGPI